MSIVMVERRRPRQFELDNYIHGGLLGTRMPWELTGAAAGADFHDTGLHRAMGIEVHGEVKGEVSVYIDTDSLAGDSLITLSDDVIAVETEHGIKVYRMDDKVKIRRNDIEMEISASEMKDDDMLIVE